MAAPRYRVAMGRVAATLSVKPYEQLVVYVGGNGSGPTGGFDGGAQAGIGEISSSDLAGAGGGGASDVRTSTALDDRVVVAGGGGGAGSGPFYIGRDALPFGGKGGALNGGKGGGGSKCRERGRTGERLDNCGYGGAGGTQSAGGAGGMSGNSELLYGHQTHICGADGTKAPAEPAETVEGIRRIRWRRRRWRRRLLRRRWRWRRCLSARVPGFRRRRRRRIVVRRARRERRKDVEGIESR